MVDKLGKLSVILSNGWSDVSWISKNCEKRNEKWQNCIEISPSKNTKKVH